MKKEKFNIAKTFYPKPQYNKVIDNSFTQLITIPEEVPSLPTVGEFFELYNQLFFDIPKKGEVNSHEFLIKESTQYVDSKSISPELEALLEEVSSLREQLLEANQKVLELTKQNTIDTVSELGTDLETGAV
tara:strand:- start:2051 stop:2443 length:393 start_codon:yes stop_codon:yes gene_type:complete